MRPAPGRATYPRSLRGVSSCARRCLRRDVDAHPSFTWQRPAPGRRVRMARDPGGLLRPLPPRRQQWRLCAVTALRAQGVNVDVRATGRGGKPKHRSRTQIAVTRVPQGSPGTRAGSQGARRGSQGGAQPALPGPGGTGPRVADEAPAYPSHPRPHRRRRTARGRLPARFTRRRWKGASKDGCRRRPRRCRARESGW